MKDNDLSLKGKKLLEKLPEGKSQAYRLREKGIRGIGSEQISS